MCFCVSCTTHESKREGRERKEKKFQFSIEIDMRIQNIFAPSDNHQPAGAFFFVVVEFRYLSVWLFIGFSFLLFLCMTFFHAYNEALFSILFPLTWWSVYIVYRYYSYLYRQSVKQMKSLEVAIRNY
ncbi:hypothetical protein ACKWTF_004590 [Chironomus riparius]